MATIPLRADSVRANPIARRDMLAAALLGGAAFAAPAAAAPSASPWQMAMQRFEAARAAETSFDMQVWSPAYQAAEMDAHPIPDHIDAELTRLTDKRCDAEDALIFTPAPHLSAVVWKIEYARIRWEDFSDWPSTWWRAVMSDLSRLDAMRGGC